MTDSLVQADGSSGIGNTEFYLKQVLAGDEEGVRARLIGALETLNYVVLSEHPLQAKRGARGLGAFYASADVLDYPTRLTVALKPLGAGATLVTLDYEVKDAWNFSTKGDRQTLRREAEAILALAADRVAPTSCRACGAHNPGDSQFCRLCGTHYAAGEPAELEVLRLTAGARAGHQLNLIGMVFGLAGLLFALLLAASGKAAAAKLSFLALALGEVIALVVMTFGASYLHRALNPKRRGESPPAGARGSLPPARYDSSPPPLMRGSVTEGTTDLLEARPGRRTAVELRRERESNDPTEQRAGN
jgi:ribosomal protein L40E